MSIKKLCKKIFEIVEEVSDFPTMIDVMKADYDKAIQHFIDHPVKNVNEQKIVDNVFKNIGFIQRSAINESRSFLIKIQKANASVFESNVSPAFKARYAKLLEEIDDDYVIVASSVADEEDAKDMATKKKGLIIQDEEDDKKFSVIVKEGMDDDKYPYTTEVRVDVSEGNASVEASTATLHYDFEYDKRSWGIKGIEFSPNPIVEVTLSYEGGETEIPITIDLSEHDVDIVWEAGQAYVPDMISFKVDSDNNVSDISIYIYYLTK